MLEFVDAGAQAAAAAAVVVTPSSVQREKG